MYVNILAKLEFHNILYQKRTMISNFFFLFVQKERPTNSLVKKEERVDPKIEKEPEDKRSNSDLESRVQELYG